MVFSRICVNNNGDSSSFLDDSEEMMDATKRIVWLFNEYIFCILGRGYTLSDDLLLFASLCTKRTLDLNNSIFCRRDAVD
ncbi:hypothetical protein T4A_11950 [Trichinella pseudospiralis]|uniref:Uncharacterized protein n=1 Tax=Trichinella pseudospiralis TaxID=6337 RepID=A0A0V1EKQ0_TRIPS|nr:hypothetical protein T4A_11950 [Trichinella pseudospiralis]